MIWALQDVAVLNDNHSVLCKPYKYNVISWMHFFMMICAQVLNHGVVRIKKFSISI